MGGLEDLNRMKLPLEIKLGFFTAVVIAILVIVGSILGKLPPNLVGTVHLLRLWMNYAPHLR